MIYALNNNSKWALYCSDETCFEIQLNKYWLFATIPVNGVFEKFALIADAWLAKQYDGCGRKIDNDIARLRDMI